MLPQLMSARKSTGLGLVAATLLAASPQVLAQVAPSSATAPTARRTPAMARETSATDRRTAAATRGTIAPVQAGFSYTPFVSLSTTYDDNLFASTTNRQSDTILSVAPGILLGYHSRRTDFNLLYSLSADKYLHHSELDSLVDEQLGAVDFHHRVTRRFSFGISGSYVETHNPGQISPESGLILGRNRATDTTLQPEIAYDLSPTSSMRFFYERSWQNISTGDQVQTGTASGGYTNQLSERNSLNLLLQNVAYEFNTGGSPNSTVFTVGWTHDFTPLTSMTLAAGPRDTEGSIRPELLASVAYRSRHKAFFVAYQKTQTVVIGETELLDTQSVSAGFAFTPTRQFTIGFSPSYNYNTGPTVDARGWRLGFFTWYRFAPSWSLGLTYSYEHQRETYNNAPSGTIQRNLISLTLRWQLPGRGRPLQIVPFPTAGPGPGPRG